MANEKTQTPGPATPEQQQLATTRPAAQPTEAQLVAQSEAIVTEPQVIKVKGTLTNLRHHFADALPKHLDASRFLRVALTAIQRTPKLATCKPASLFAALLQCAALGLEPDGLLGQAYLIPFGDEVQFIPGYRGLIKLVRQSGEIAAIYARVVRAGDDFKYSFGLQEKLLHRPGRAAGGGELVAVYAVARFKGGELPQFDVMERWEVDRIRDMSQGYKRAEGGRKDSPWHQHYEAMAMKTVIRRLCKVLPQSIDRNVATAVALDEAAEANLSQAFDVDVPPEMAERPTVTPETEGRRLALGARGKEIEQKREAAEREPGAEG